VLIVVEGAVNSGLSFYLLCTAEEPYSCVFFLTLGSGEDPTPITNDEQNGQRHDLFGGLAWRLPHSRISTVKELRSVSREGSEHPTTCYGSNACDGDDDQLRSHKTRKAHTSTGARRTSGSTTALTTTTLTTTTTTTTTARITTTTLDVTRPINVQIRSWTDDDDDRGVGDFNNFEAAAPYRSGVRFACVCGVNGVRVNKRDPRPATNTTFSDNTNRNN